MEQRRTRRFKLQLPLSITRSGAERVTSAGLTRNISSSGVLFTAEREPDLGGSIEYVISPEPRRPADWSICAASARCCAPSALDTGPDEPKTNFQVAATLERYEFVRGR